MWSTDTNETVLYRLKKSKAPIAFMLVFFPIWLFFGALFMIAYYRHLFLGESELEPEIYLILVLAVFLVCIPMVLAISLSYALNSLVITDRRIIIRRGIGGRTNILNIGDVRSFQYITSPKNRNLKIQFYLHCGQIVKTGELFITFGSYQALLDVLREKFEGRGFSRKELKRMGEENPDAAKPRIKTNFFVLTLFLLPFILAILAIAEYLIKT